MPSNTNSIQQVPIIKALEAQRVALLPQTDRVLRTLHTHIANAESDKIISFSNCEALLPAIRTILAHSGFEIRESPNETWVKISTISSDNWSINLLKLIQLAAKTPSYRATCTSSKSKIFNIAMGEIKRAAQKGYSKTAPFPQPPELKNDIWSVADISALGFDIEINEISGIFYWQISWRNSDVNRAGEILIARSYI